MEISQAKWESEMELMEDSTGNFFQQYQINPVEYSLDELDFQSFSSESYSSYNHNMSNNSASHLETYQTGTGGVVVDQRPAKQLKTNSWNSFTTTTEYQQNNTIVPKASSSSCSRIISFENSNSSPAAMSQQYYGMDHRRVKPKTEVAAEDSNGNTNMNFSSITANGCFEEQLPRKHAQGAAKRVGSGTRSTLYAQDHVMAERKRREKLSQRFIALSTLLPGLKKMDKASVLGDAIKYLKQLQERVTTLEEQTAKKTMESIIFVKKSQIGGIDDESSLSDENFGSESNQLPLPEIEARVSNKDVLIRIHCEKNKAHVVNILVEIEKLNLTVVNSNVFAFGNSTLHITVVAKMEAEFSMTLKDLVKNLRFSLLPLC